MSEALRSDFRMLLTGLLPRLRQTLEFPLDPMEVYLGAITPQGRWLFDPTMAATDITDPTMVATDITYRNVRRVTERNDVIHFHLAPPSIVDDDKVSGVECTFWVRMPHDVVAPVNRNHGLLLLEDVRTSPALRDWFKSAEALDNKIQYFNQAVYSIAPTFSSKMDIRLAWPEIVQVVPFIAEPKSRVSEETMRNRQGERIDMMRETIHKHLPPVVMQDFLDTLATTVMLTHESKLPAWVGTNKEGR